MFFWRPSHRYGWTIVLIRLLRLLFSNVRRNGMSSRRCVQVARAVERIKMRTLAIVERKRKIHQKCQEATPRPAAPRRECECRRERERLKATYLELELQEAILWVSSAWTPIRIVRCDKGQRSKQMSAASSTVGHLCILPRVFWSTMLTIQTE